MSESSQQPVQAMFLPLSGTDLTREDQLYLLQRAQASANCLPADLLRANPSASAYRTTPAHDNLRLLLMETVDNETAWPEYIHVSRLTEDAKGYEYMVSTSEVADAEPPTVHELTEGMRIALAEQKPVVLGMPGNTLLAVVPLLVDKGVAGFLTFVKQSWEPNQRRILAFPDSHEQEMRWRIEALEARVVALEGDRRELRKAIVALQSQLSPSQISVERGTVRLGYGDGVADGRRSYGGSGHAIRFESPAGRYRLCGLQLFGSRYGTKEPPNEKFEIHILDEARGLLQTLQFPYALFDRGPDRWVFLTVSPWVTVPAVFWVAVEFHANETDGVYLGFERTGTPSRSMVGTPSAALFPWDPNADWMIGAFVCPGN